MRPAVGHALPNTRYTRDEGRHENGAATAKVAVENGRKPAAGECTCQIGNCIRGGNTHLRTPHLGSMNHSQCHYQCQIVWELRQENNIQNKMAPLTTDSSIPLYINVYNSTYCTAAAILLQIASAYIVHGWAQRFFCSCKSTARSFSVTCAISNASSP